VTTNRLSMRISWIGLILCLFANALPAQTSSDSGPVAPQSSSKTEDSKPVAPTPDIPPDAPASKSSNPRPDPFPNRMLVTIPDFESTSDTPAALTADQKYTFALHQAFDPGAHVVNTFRAALQQAANGQPHYGQGWRAYEKRFAAGEGDQFTGAMLTDGVLPSILHQDPRYFRRASGSAIARFWYALNRTLVTRNDNGTSAFNTSETLGELISCGISTSYYPSRDRTVGYLTENWGVSLGSNSGFNVVSEFFPDLKRIFFHRDRQPVPPSGN
jgi:hypothetical protein